MSDVVVKVQTGPQGPAGPQGPQGPGAAVANDIITQGGSTINRVGGINRVPLTDNTGTLVADQTAPPVGGTWVYNAVGANSLKGKHPTQPGHWDPADFGAVADWNGTTGTDNAAAFAAMLTAMAAASAGKHNRAQKIVLDGHYYLSTGLTFTQTVVVQGSGKAWAIGDDTPGVPGNRCWPGTSLVFPSGVIGLRFKSTGVAETPSQTSSADRSVLRDLTVYCKDAPGTNTAHHGIYATTTVLLENVHVESFGGDGIRITGYLDAPGDGNADGSVLINCQTKSNQGDGYHLAGNDVQPITFIGCSAFVNVGDGFYESSHGGCAYTGCHSEGNTGYQYHIATPLSTLCGCYSEGERNQIVRGTLVLGGTLAGAIQSGHEPFDIDGYGQVWHQPLQYNNTRGANRVVSMFGESMSTSNMQVLRWETYEAADPTTLQDWSYLAYAGDSDPWWVFYNRSGNNEVLRFPTAAANYRRSAPWATSGIFLGEWANGTIHFHANTAPAEHRPGGLPVTYEVGDTTWQSSPTTGDKFAVRCLAAGTFDDLTYFTGATCSATNGSGSLTSVTNTTGLEINQRIAVAGASGTYRITAVGSGTLTVTPSISGIGGGGSVTLAAITFVAPTFENLYPQISPTTVQAMSALNVDWSAATVYTKTLANGSNTITFSNVEAGQSITVRLTGSGSSTVTWPADVAWPSGTVPTQTPGGTDVYFFVSDGTNVYGHAVQAMATFDYPATLALTGYLKDYGGSLPWGGTASAGTSGSNSFDIGSTPLTGSSFAGHPSALYDGTNTIIQDDVGHVAAYISTTAWTLQWILVASAYGAPDSSPDNEVGLWVDYSSGYFRVTLSSSGVRACVYPSTNTPYASVPSVGTKMCIQCVCDGVTLKIRVNGGSWQSVAAATIAGGTTAFATLGSNFDGSHKFAGEIAQFLSKDSALSDPTMDALYADAQAQYGVP